MEEKKDDLDKKIKEKAKKGTYKDLWQSIIRPPRDEYAIEELGPDKFRINNRAFQRRDFELENSRKLKFKCSWWEPLDSQRPVQQLPCVVYLHGNSSSRIEALACVNVVLPMNMTLVALDFSGSGLSEGEYISLGFHQREDVRVLMEYLRASGKVSAIALWGRSMGAVTALLHADRDHSVAGLVSDSAFSSLQKLSKQLFRKYSKKMPGFFFSIAYRFVKGTVKKKAKFDMNEINPLKHVPKAFVPSFFISAKDDDFIHPHHSDDLLAAYQGEKQMLQCEGDHNSPRPDYVLTSAAIFLHNATQASKIPDYVPGPDDLLIARSFPQWGSFFASYDFFDQVAPGVGAQIIHDDEQEKLALMLQQMTVQPKTVVSVETAVEEVLRLAEKHGEARDVLRQEVATRMEVWRKALTKEQQEMILEIVG